QKQAAEHGRERDGDQTRYQNGNADGDREFAEQPSQDAGHEQDWNEHRGQRQSHGDDREHDLSRSVQRRLQPRLAPFQVADDVLEHDDGVIDYEADRKDQRHHGQVIETIIEQIHDRERAHDGDRQRDAGNHRGRPVAQEHEDDADHHADREPHGELHVVERLADGLAAIAPHVELGGGRELGVEDGDQLLDFLDHLDDVASRLTKREQTDSADRAVGVVQPGNTPQVLLVVYYCRDLFQAHRLTIPPGHDHRPIVRRFHQLPAGVDVEGVMGPDQSARGHVDVPVLNGLR